MAAAEVRSAGRPLRLNASASNQSLSHLSSTLNIGPFMNGSKGPVEVSTPLLMMLNSDGRYRSNGMRAVSPGRIAIAGIVAAPVTKGLVTSRKLLNSSKASGLANSRRGPSSKYSGPTFSFHFFSNSGLFGFSIIPHPSYGIHSTSSSTPTALKTCCRGLNGSLLHPRTMVGPLSKVNGIISSPTFAFLSKA